MPIRIARQQPGGSSTEASPVDRRRISSRDARVSSVARTSSSSRAPARDRALSFTSLPDTLRALLTEIAANKESGSITDESSGLRFNFTKNGRKHDLEVKGGSIDEGTLKKLLETLDLSKFSSIKAKGAQLFLSTSPSSMNDAFSLFSRLKGQNQGKTKLESSVQLYHPSRAGHIRVEKLHHERGAQDQVEIHISGDITNKEINDCIKKVHAQGASIKKITRKKPEAGSRAYTLFQVRDSNVTGDSYEGSINGVLNLQTLDELKELPHLIALFNNELRISLPLLGSCENKAIGNLIIKRAGERSKEVDITVLKGEVNTEHMKSFIDRLEAPPLNLKIKSCICHTEYFPQNTYTRIIDGTPLEASKYSFIDPLGNGLIQETSDLNRVLDLRTAGLASQGRAFRTQCSSRQEFVEMATAQALRDSAVAFDPNESEENKKRLCIAAAFNMFVEASFSEVACMGTKNVDFTSFIKSSVETRGNERGILGATETLEISQKKILLSSDGLFRGASTFVDEHLALNLIRSSLGIDLGKNDYSPLAADQKAKYQEVLDKILRGESLGDAPRERQLENCLKQLGAIIEEKYLDSFKVFTNPSAVADRVNNVSVMRAATSPIGGIDALIKEEVLNAAKEVKRMYPFLLRSRDIELLTQEIVSPEEYYGHADFNADNVPLMNERNRRLIAEAIKNIAYSNMLRKCRLSKRRLPGYTNRVAGVNISTPIEHWSLSYGGQAVLSCITDGRNFSTSHELSSQSQGFRNKNLAIFKAKEFLDNGILADSNLAKKLKELILFPLTLIDHNISLDFTVGNVDISKLTSLSENRAECLRELKRDRVALASVGRIKNALISKRALFDTHPLLDSSNNSGRLYASIIAAVEDRELVGDLVDVRKDDGAATYDLDGGEIKIKSTLRDYMQKFLLPEQRVAIAAPRVLRQVEQPILERYLGPNLRAALAEIRNDVEGITLVIDRDRRELNNRTLNASSYASLRAQRMRMYDAHVHPCLYGAVLANVAHIRSQAQRTRMGEELERTVIEFARNTRALSQRLPRAIADVSDIDQRVQVEILSKILGRKIHIYNRANSVPIEVNGVAGLEDVEFSGEPIRLINFDGWHYYAMLPIEEV
ncbi:MAG: hypothetical protein GWP59_05715 [Chlamydiales bacterium]|nr:hypothetical protein [Chlamydiales bacterium]